MAMKYSKDQPQGFTNYVEKVIVVGAGGRMGKHITEQLLKTGKHTITALTRPSSTSEIPEGATVVRLDYDGDDDTELVEALRGQQALITCLAVTAQRGTVDKLAQAAAKAGVPYIFPNYYGIDAYNEKLLREAIPGGYREALVGEIEKLGVSAFFLIVCGFWFEFSLGGGPNRYGFDFSKRTLLLLDGGNTPINTTTWDHTAKGVANLLSLKEFPDDESDKSVTLSQFANKPIYMSSFRVTQLDLFASVKRVTGTKDADWTVTHESSEQRWKDGQAAMKGGDLSAFTKQLYSRVWFPDGGGDFETVNGTQDEILGLPKDDLDKATAVAVQMGLNGEIPFSH